MGRDGTDVRRAAFFHLRKGSKEEFTMAEFSYELDKDFDYTIDEKGNSFIALRKIND